jgi:acyl transferase domain-containing protein
MRDIGPSYESRIAQHLQHGLEMMPFFSTVTREAITNPRHLDATYWRRNLESPVLFSDAVNSVLQQGVDRIFLEVGPHSVLAAPLRQIYQDITAKTLQSYIPTLTRYDDDCRSSLLSTAGEAYTAGIPVNLSSIIGEGNTLTDLPLYPWQHNTRYWSESRLSRDWRLRSVPHHELLGSRVVESTNHEPSWRNVLRLESVPWLWDHILQGDVVFPGAGYIAMAGEAIQQLHQGSDSGSYSIRNVIFKAPLTLRDGEFTEIITNLKPVELADNVHSGWYAFIIEAHDGKTWTQHCQGQVHAGCEHPPKAKVIQPYARAIPSGKWFRAVRRCGLKCGTRFQGLKDITADPTSHHAAATLTDPHELHDSRYALHPTAIDQCFQLLGVAACLGVTRNLARMYVPARIDTIFIANGEPQMAVKVSTRQAPRDGQLGDAIVMFDHRVVLVLKGCYLFALDEPTVSGSSVRLATRMKWKPHIDLLPPDGLLPAPLNSQGLLDRVWTAGKLCILYILDTAGRIRDVDPGSPHLIKWKRWIMAEASKAAEGKQSIYPDSRHWAQLHPGSRKILVEQALAQMRSTKDLDVSTCLQQVFDHCVDFMSGKRSPLEALMENHSLERYYASHQQRVDWSRFLDLQCHANPGLRVLEIGAGTGAATREALKHLKSPDGIHMYSQYVFTDISPAFMAAAQEKFGIEENLEYRVLDISRDPVQQGFESHGFDLIIASNVSFLTAGKP